MKFVKLDLKRKRNWALLILISIITTLSFKYLTDKGETYKLPPESIVKKSNRHIQDYLGNDFEWFLYTPDKVALYVKEIGQGETIVTLHGGFGMSHDYLRDFMKPFEENYHVVYYDQRGSLRSPVPKYDFNKYITMENMVNDLELLRRELGLEKLKIVAHSMGAVLAYEYMEKFPQNVGDLVIISGFSPKFPASNAEYHDLFTSQAERLAFSQRSEVSTEVEEIRENIDTNSAEFVFLNYKINSSALQFYDIGKWREAACGANYFNPEINEIIGPESHIPLIYGLRFFQKNRQFKRGTLDTLNTKTFNTPINYLPTIKKHQGRIDYMLGTHEVGDWKLRLYQRNIKQNEKVKMHIFENAGHNIWIDQEKEFHLKLKEILSSSG